MSNMFNKEMAHPRGFEPLTSAFGGQRTAQLVNSHFSKQAEIITLFMVAMKSINTHDAKLLEHRSMIGAFLIIYLPPSWNVSLAKDNGYVLF